MNPIVFAFIVLLHPIAALAAGGTLAKALTKPRPVIVHVWDAKPAELQAYAIEDVSMACREAGATAVLVSPELIEVVAKEQETSRGNFPGKLYRHKITCFATDPAHQRRAPRHVERTSTRLTIRSTLLSRSTSGGRRL